MPSRHRSGSGLRGSWFHLLWYLARSGWGTNGSYDSYELWRFLFVHKGRIWRILNTWALQSMILARWILLRLRSLLWSPCIPDSFASFAGHSAYGTSQTNRQAAARATPQQDTLAGALRRPTVPWAGRKDILMGKRSSKVQREGLFKQDERNVSVQLQLLTIIADS